MYPGYFFKRLAKFEPGMHMWYTIWMHAKLGCWTARSLHPQVHMGAVSASVFASASAALLQGMFVPVKAIIRACTYIGKFMLPCYTLSVHCSTSSRSCNSNPIRSIGSLTPWLSNHSVTPPSSALFDGQPQSRNRLAMRLGVTGT